MFVKTCSIYRGQLEVWIYPEVSDLGTCLEENTTRTQLVCLRNKVNGNEPLQTAGAGAAVVVRAQ